MPNMAVSKTNVPLTILYSGNAVSLVFLNRKCVLTDIVISYGTAGMRFVSPASFFPFMPLPIPLPRSLGGIINEYNESN